MMQTCLIALMEKKQKILICEKSVAVQCQTYKTEIWETKSVCLYFNFVLVFNYLILVWIVSLYKQNSHKIQADAASNFL